MPVIRYRYVGFVVVLKIRLLNELLIPIIKEHGISLYVLACAVLLFWIQKECKIDEK